jgi:signal transduction histidine kinase
MSSISALDTDAPVGLDELLDRNARVALTDGAAALGMPLTIVDDQMRMLIGTAPLQWDGVPSDWDPQIVTLAAGRVGGVGIYNEGELIGRMAIGPMPDLIDDEIGLRILAQHKRIIDAFIIDGMKRALSARIHMATLEEANRELTEKNRKLAEMVDKLQEADRIKSNFLATVSHELRTPLTSVIGYSEMLLEGIAGALNDEQRDYVRTVMEKGDQLLQLITGILDISRMEAGEMRVRRTPFDFGEVVRVAMSTVTPAARRKRVVLDTVVPENLPDAFGDRDKTRQVVLNLVGNAVKFTPEGGTVRVSVALGGLAREDKHAGAPGLRVAVSDTGIGIPADSLQRVFDPFYQVDNSSTREYGGTGLGLSIVKRFVEAQGGQVWLESEVGRGTTFTFTMPVEETG